MFYMKRDLNKTENLIMTEATWRDHSVIWKSQVRKKKAMESLIKKGLVEISETDADWVKVTIKK